FTIEKMFGSRWGKVSGWNATPDVIPHMFDGLPDRQWMGAENWNTNITVKGGVWQTATLPAGEYTFLIERGWNFGDVRAGANRAYFAVAKGDELKWTSPFIAKADLGIPESQQTYDSIQFNLPQKMEVSLGYVLNFPPHETNALGFWRFTLKY